ncbi:MAG: hypothetical protein U0R44_03730 [Candidatus Micrarchaeia archaeon]
MDEGGYVARSVRVAPDLASAIYALDLASDTLRDAKEKFTSHDLQGALDGSRDAIRIASSALMFRDGYVTADFDRTVRFLRSKYDDQLPLRAWERVEMAYLGEGGLYNMLLVALGKERKSDDDLVSEALSVAETFIIKARKELDI